MMIAYRIKIFRLTLSQASVITCSNSSQTTKPSYTGWDQPPLNSNPVIAGAQSMFNFLAIRFKPGTKNKNKNNEKTP